jgi:protocatechuate 3,4-dioxygenase beta subunit
MSESSRRDFLRLSGLAAAGAAGGVLTLRAEARPTAASANAAIEAQALDQFGEPPTITIRDDAKPTPRNALGPFFIAGAPFRGKVSPARAPGSTLVVTGRVWGFDTKKPLPGAAIDLWHCDVHGNYSTDDGEFKYRARIITSETGAYEYETIHPVVYNQNGDLRSPHIHYRVTSPGYRTLVTQVFFQGDPKQNEDRLFDPTLMVPVVRKPCEGGEYESAVFDLVLDRAPADRAR